MCVCEREKWFGDGECFFLRTALGSLVILTLYEGARLLWKPPLYPIPGFPWRRGLRSSLRGCRGHPSSLTVWMLALLQRHSHITFPWEPTPVDRCRVPMETACGQVAEDKWGDVRVSGWRLKCAVASVEFSVLSCTHTRGRCPSRTPAVSTLD